MRIYTIIPSKDPDALTHWARDIAKLRPTGITLFARPDILTPQTQSQTIPQEQTPAYFQTLADQAASRKEYAKAAEFAEKASEARARLQAQNAAGAQWVKDAVLPLKDITQLVVLGNAHWNPADPFTADRFLAKIAQISSNLLTTGIGGVVQKTPLTDRAFIPLTTADIAGGLGEPEAPSPSNPESVTIEQSADAEDGVEVDDDLNLSLSAAEKAKLKEEVKAEIKKEKAQNQQNEQKASPRDLPKSHEHIPKELKPMQVKYAILRLGMDEGRGGKKRSRAEASNMLGLSHAQGAKMEAEIDPVWPNFTSMCVLADMEHEGVELKTHLREGFTTNLPQYKDKKYANMGPKQAAQAYAADKAKEKAANTPPTKA